TALLVAANGVLGCAVNLEPESSPKALPAPSAAVLPSCLPLSDRTDALEGRLGALALVDGTALLTAENATIDGDPAPTGFENADKAACLAGADVLAARPLIDVSPLAATVGSGVVARPLAGVTTDAAYLFFVVDQGLASAGIGVARFDAGVAR